MKIGIDISQTAYQATGVANYTRKLVTQLLKSDPQNQYLLFYSSLRKPLDPEWRKQLEGLGAEVKTFPFPLGLLELLWNQLHLLPIELLLGPIDLFFSSDWIQPPTKAKKVTTIHDLSIFKSPQNIADKIIRVHRRRLKWVKKEADLVICDSLATQKDVAEILAIPSSKLRLVYPGGLD